MLLTHKMIKHKKGFGLGLEIQSGLMTLMTYTTLMTLMTLIALQSCLSPCSLKLL